MWPFSMFGSSGDQYPGFDHPRIYREINGGPGVTSLSAAAGTLSGQFHGRLNRVNDLVTAAVSRCNRSWQGTAAEGMRQEMGPFREVVDESEQISSTLSRGVENQGDHFARTRDTVPPPYEVPPLDLGFSDIAPMNLASKLAGQEIHEAKHNAAEAQARQAYTGYRDATNSTVRSMEPYPTVPVSVADVGVVDTGGAGSVPGSSGYAGYSSSGYPGGSGSAQPHTYRIADDHAPVASAPGTTPGGSDSPGFPGAPGAPGAPAPGAGSPWAPGGADDSDSSGYRPPASSGSAWTPPPASGSATLPAPGVGSGGTVSPGSGTGGGFVSGGGAGTGRGGTGGRSGTGAGRVGGGYTSGGRTGGIGAGGGYGNGTGTPGGRSFGPGGRSGYGTTSGIGTPGSAGTTSSTGTGRGAYSGAAAPGGRGQDTEDEEHERKYIEETGDHFEFDGNVDPITGRLVAPPVIGEFRPDSHYRP